MGYSKLLAILKNLDKYLSNSNYKGYDPFDGLNSRLIENFKIRGIQLAWIQFFKKSPLNFRRFFNILEDHNPKGLALVLIAYCNLYQLSKNDKYLEKAYYVVDLLKGKRTLDRPYHCWGYNFPWMARAFYVPRFKPNMIVSSFVGQAFLDLYELDQNPEWLKISIEISDFIKKELIIINSVDHFCFGYIPGENVIVHNANLMGALLFARLASILKSDDLRNIALRSVDYSVSQQNSDGSWVYGNLPHHQWVDNFHTGFNLVAISKIQNYLGLKKWQNNLDIGIKYHKENHYLADMTPKYYNNKLFPVDIHNYAQGIITFSSLGMMEKAKKILEHCLSCMWDDKLGLFYYQHNRFYKNKINYLRWSQAWMFYAISFYLFSSKEKLNDSL